MYAETSDYNWEYIDTISLPSSVDFQDYSGMDVDGNVIAIVSQEESKLWIGKLAVFVLDLYRYTYIIYV